MKSMLLHITNNNDKNILKKIYDTIKEDSFVEINLTFDSISHTKFNEIIYEISSKIITIKIDDIAFETNKYELLQYDLIADMLDERINSNIQSNLSNYIESKDRSDLFNWRELQPLIDSAPNLEALYFKIQNNIVKIPEYAKNSILFKIISTTSRFNDIEIVENFLENNFDIKYAEIILLYPKLNKKIVDKFIQDPKINQIVLQDYLDSNNPIPEVDFFTEKTDSTDIEKFFNLLMKKDDSFSSAEYIFKFLNLKQTPANILMEIYSRYDIEFICDLLLSHPNCPRILLIKYSKFPAFGLAISKNPSLTDGILSFLLKNNSGSFNQEKIYNAILENDKISYSIKREIQNTIKLKENIINQSNIYSLLSVIPISEELKKSIINKYAVGENIHIFNRNELLLSDSIDITNKLIEKFSLIEKNIKTSEGIKNIVEIKKDLEITAKDLESKKILFMDQINAEQSELVQQITNQLINTNILDENTISEIKADLNKIYNSLINDFNKKISLQNQEFLSDDIALTIVQKNIDSTVTKTISESINSNILGFKSNMKETITFIKENHPNEFSYIKNQATLTAKNEIAELIKLKDFKKINEIKDQDFKLQDGLVDLSSDTSVTEKIEEFISNETQTIKKII